MGGYPRPCLGGCQRTPPGFVWVLAIGGGYAVRPPTVKGLHCSRPVARRGALGPAMGPGDLEDSLDADEALALEMELNL